MPETIYTNDERLGALGELDYIARTPGEFRNDNDRLARVLVNAEIALGNSSATGGKLLSFTIAPNQGKGWISLWYVGREWRDTLFLSGESGLSITQRIALVALCAYGGQNLTGNQFAGYLEDFKRKYR